jgi:hypothetical protein
VWQKVKTDPTLFASTEELPRRGLLESRRIVLDSPVPSSGS